MPRYAGYISQVAKGVAAVFAAYEGNTAPLPPGYTVRGNNLGGFDFLNEEGNIVFQHPVDDNAIRHLLWDIYGIMEDQKLLQQDWLKSS